MIDLLSLPYYLQVHVVGSGQSADRFFGVPIGPKDLVISVNDAAYRVATYLEGVPHIHFCLDLPYVQTHPVAKGALGVWRRPHMDHPLPLPTEFPCWTLLGERTKPDSGGCTAWSIADLVAVDRVHLWGFDGGGKYERMHEEAEKLAARVRKPYTDHAGRL